MQSIRNQLLAAIDGAGADGLTEGDIRVDLIRGISANHVHNSLVATRMVLQPYVNLKDLLVHNDNSPSICNQPLDLPPRIQGIFSTGSSCQHCEGNKPEIDRAA
jgi:hypothetical protein